MGYWILVVMLNTSTNYATTIAMQEFVTEERCQKAAALVKTKQAYALAECIQK